MVYEELMKSFAARFGVTGIVIDEDIAAVKVDDITVGFLNDKASDTITIVANLGGASVNADGPFGSMMLKANHLFQATKGATLFENPENESYGLQQMYTLSRMDVDTLSAEVEKLVNLAEYWKRILDGCAVAQQEYDKARKAKTPEQSGMELSGEGFMRI